MFLCRGCLLDLPRPSETLSLRTRLGFLHLNWSFWLVSPVRSVSLDSHVSGTLPRWIATVTPISMRNWKSSGTWTSFYKGRFLHKGKGKGKVSGVVNYGSVLLFHSTRPLSEFFFVLNVCRRYCRQRTNHRQWRLEESVYLIVSFRKTSSCTKNVYDF